MKCPVCRDVELVMSERNGIEIDYCPSCRGVWLDRGELDKIIDRSLPSAAGPRHEAYSAHGHDSAYRHQQKKKRGSFISELFDFD